jgi:ATP-binding protein involved in chromosome partitioning
MIEKILTALKEVDDPDLHKDIVSLNMVQDLKVDGDVVSFRLVLTTPACPMKEVIKNACINAIQLMVDKNLSVDITFDSIVTSKNTTATKGVKNIIAVSSGKGGVGKSTVAVNLALALAMEGAKVGILDADIYGPSIPTMLGTRGLPSDIYETPEGKMRIRPFEVFGVKSMSIGNLIDDNQALVWRGPMISTALKQLMNDVDWGDLDYLIADMPPGTGDVHLTLAQQFPLTGVVMVTTPQDVALVDCTKSIIMYRTKGVEAHLLGIVENMSYFTPEDSPEKQYFIFGKGGADKLSKQFDIPVVGRLPLFETLAVQSDSGVPAMLHPDERFRKPFIEMAQQVAQQVSILNG